MPVLCGVAIGYPDLDSAVNAVRVSRNPLADNVVFGEN
jgi:hypothetical protein